MKHNIISFNHISERLTPEEVEKYKKLYEHYHRLFTCYRWKYKSIKKIKLALEMTSLGLTTIGTVLGAITVNPIVLGSIAGPGILMQAYHTKTDMLNKVNQCTFAYTSYQKTLTEIRTYLRGASYDEAVFISNMKVIDDTVIDMCPPVINLYQKYNEKYTIQ